MRFLSKLIVLALVGALCFMFYYTYQQNQKESSLSEKIEQYNKILRQIREEKAKLENESKYLYENLYLPDMGSTLILLSDTKVEQLDDAISIMDDYDYHGLIALSLNCLPEDNIEGYLTSQDIDELVSKGYELVIRLNNEDINKTYQSFIDKGYDIKGFYFENVSVGKAKIDTIRKIDPNLAIIGQFEDNVNYSDMLLINAYGSKQSGVKTAYEDSIGVSKTMALAVGYENSKNQYTYDNFIAMVKLINSHIYADETDLCNITEAKQRYDEYLIELQEQLPDQVERINEINERLQLIEKEMTNIK